MPFHSHHQQNTAQNQPAGTASGIYQATQALGSIGAPQGNLRLATSGTTMAGTDALLPGSGNAPGLGLHGAGGQTAPPTTSGLPGPGPSVPSSGSQQQYEGPRRTGTMGRTPEELHISAGPGAIGQHNSSQTHLQQTASHQQPHQTPPSAHGQQPQQQQQQQQPLYDSPQQYSAAATPNINLQQATPQTSHYASAPSGSAAAVPGSLQPGNAQRPGPSSAYSAPAVVPTVPQINTNSQQYTLPTRSNTMNTSHTYSRSSPAGLEQKYIPFSNTPENAKYASSPNPKYYTPSTPSGPASNSPLALADIRPRGNSSVEESMGSGSMAPDFDKVPTNSNYLASWGAYAFDWCKWPLPSGNSAGKMAVGSYLEDAHNFISIVDTQIVPQELSSPGAPSYGIEYVKVAEATCSYPVTRILWEPPSTQKQSTDLLATSGDHLRLWSLPQTTSTPVSSTITRSSAVNNREPQQKLTPLALLSNSKSPEHTAPLTSLDWNTLSPKLIITSSIDTTCTIWDIPTLTAKTQLIAHDKEVFDVRFCAGSVDVFVSCGADGSVRMFDLRSLEHSTIIYEPSDKNQGDKGDGSSGRMSPTKAQQTMTYNPPLLRLAASPHDSHLLATFAADSSLIRILDVRQPGQALLELRGHAASVNSIEWSPSRRGMLASGGDDSLVLVWDLIHQNNGAMLNGSEAAANPTPTHHPGTGSSNGGQIQQKGPYASWKCDYEVGNLSWSPQSALTAQGGEWLGVCGGRGVWGVKL